MCNYEVYGVNIIGFILALTSVLRDRILGLALHRDTHPDRKMTAIT